MVKIGETWRHSDVTHGWPIMTWVLIFWHKVWSCCPERCGKFQSEIPSTSGTICEKPQGGPLPPPPSGARVNVVPSSARGCKKAGLIRLSFGPLACPQGTASLPVPKQAPDSPNPINRNSTSVSTNTTHWSLTGIMWRRLSCSRCRKPWNSIVCVACVFSIPVCMIALYDRKPRLGHKM